MEFEKTTAILDEFGDELAKYRQETNERIQKELNQIQLFMCEVDLSWSISEHGTGFSWARTKLVC